MFDLLRSIPFGEVNETVYRVGLRLSERDRFPTWRRWVGTRPGSTVSPGAVASAIALLEELEAHAGTPLHALSDAQVERYSRMMDRIVSERDRRELRFDALRARKALEELRRMYGNPSCHAAA